MDIRRALLTFSTKEGTIQERHKRDASLNMFVPFLSESSPGLWREYSEQTLFKDIVMKPPENVTGRGTGTFHFSSKVILWRSTLWNHQMD